LVSHIFGRSITWSEYRKIREFLMDHENIPLSLLRYAWPYRDSKQASRVCFRMTWRIGVSAFFYSIVCMGLTLVTLFGAFLVWLSFLVPPALALEFSLIPQLQQFLLFLGVQHGEQLRPLGLWIIPSPLAILILTVVFYYDGYAAFRICRKTESHAKQNKSCTPR
jgi:hypothetical protein